MNQRRWGPSSKSWPSIWQPGQPVHLGGGRLKQGDRINASVGLSEIAGIGEHVSPDLPFALIHAASEADADRAEAALRVAFTISDDVVADPPLVHRRFG